MKIFSATQIRDWDQYTIQHEPIAAIDLMERASMAVSTWMAEHFDRSKKIKIFCGQGNNGADGLAIARLLIEKKYQIEVFIIRKGQASEDFKINEKRLLNFLSPQIISSNRDFPILLPDEILIDAIFGTGLNKPVEGLFAELIKLINESKATVVSVDIASGLCCDKHNENKIIVEPAYTLSFQQPKLSFLLPENEKYVGIFHVLNIGLHPDFYEKNISSNYYISKEDIKPLIKKRNKYSHKGTYGKSLIMGGNYGMIGAVLLATKACYRSGAGLVTAYLPACGYEIMQTAVPEAMCITDAAEEKITEIPDISSYNAIGVGPGMAEGPEAEKALEILFSTSKIPLVIDAGALNIMGREKKLMKKIPRSSILTPHPKEFERLVGSSNNDYDRLAKLKGFAKEYHCYVCLKGANTAIADPEGNIYFNSTGNPGMATGGSGDVLTGIITGLLAQGYNSRDAALIGVYMHGYAGDAAAKELSEPFIMASDIIEGISDFYQFFTKLY